jgi:hypothetical protein
MDSASRFKKPAPERVTPNRGWSGVFGAEPSVGPDEQPQSGQRDAGSAANGSAANGSAESSSAAGASSSVASAYRVIDDYLRQGRRVAENLWTPLSSAAKGPDPSLLTERFLRGTADLSAAWFDMMQALTSPMDGRANGAAPGASAGPFDAGVRANREKNGAGERHSATAPVLVVKSSRLARVSVELLSEAPNEGLTLTRLHADRPGVPSIDRAAVRSGRNAGIEIEIVIGDEQPPGTYRGALIDDASQRTSGTVTVELLDT